jgi:processive 1,2-diacylglycerol beta-glucosyltransferase
LKSIAVFYASEGTGHKTAAENLRDEFLRENPGGSVLCRDVLEYIPSFLHHTVSDGYLQMARRVPWLWGFFYWGSDKPGLEASAFDRCHNLLCRLYLPHIEKDAEAAGAEAVFFTHYFGAPNFALWYGEKFPTFYVNTDFVCHRFQRGKMYDALFVASHRAVKQHTDEGITSVYDTGIPISPKFSHLPLKDEARKALGLVPDRKIVLVSGGGIGAGAVTEAVASLAAEKSWQIIVICGSNKSLREKMAAKYEGRSNVRVEGFVNNMEYYYKAADICVMKPGGLSLSEALAAQLPLVLMDPIPGQEQLNMDYVCAAGAAKPLADAERAREAVSSLFSSAQQTAEMTRAAVKLARSGAAAEILKTAGEIAARRQKSV